MITCPAQQVLQLTNLLRVEISVRNTLFVSFFPSLFPSFFLSLFPDGFSPFLRTAEILWKRVLIIQRSQLLNLRLRGFSHVRCTGEGGDRAAFCAANGALHAEDVLAGREFQILKPLAVLRDNFTLPSGLGNAGRLAEHIEAEFTGSLNPLSLATFGQFRQIRPYSRRRTIADRRGI